MSLIKTSNWPYLGDSSWVSNFFDNTRFFNSEWVRKQSKPSVNVKETNNGFEIEVAAPELSEGDFNITVDNRVLTISSKKEKEKEQTEESGEVSYSTFNRSFALPENVNAENIEANYQNGILKLNLARKRGIPSKVKNAIEDVARLKGLVKRSQVRQFSR